MANVNVTYDELTNVATQIDQGKDSLAQTLAHLQATVDTLVSSGFVTDQASVAYDSQFGTYVTSTNQAIEALTGFSTFLRTAAQTLSEADASLAAQMQG